MAGNCQKLKFNRRRLHLTQQEFADLVGVHVSSIDKLERDETAWETIGSETIDKIVVQYSSMASYQPGKEERKEALGLKEENKTTKRGVKCNQLLKARQKLGLSQQALAKHIGLSPFAIFKLENDETVWATIKSETADKIMKFYEHGDLTEEQIVETPKPERKTFGNWSDGVKVNDDGSVSVAEEKLEKKKPELVEIVDDPKALEPIPELMFKNIVGEADNLTDKDRQLMKYVEFACGQLKESKSHEDFETNIDILTRIIKKQY